MARLVRAVDIEALISEIDMAISQGYCARSLEDMKHRLNQIPTVDAAPVVHGEWLSTKDDDKKRCSKCDVIHLIAQYPYGKANYCPNCGADMRKAMLMRKDKPDG